MSKNGKQLIINLQRNFSFAISEEEKKKNNRRSRWKYHAAPKSNIQRGWRRKRVCVQWSSRKKEKEKEREKERRRKRSSIPPLEESLICRKIFGERTCDTNPRSKSLVNDKRTCTGTGPAEYSGLEDRNCVNHPLFSFHIQITLAKLRYLNHFVVSARICQANNSRRLSSPEKKRMAPYALRNENDLLKFRKRRKQSFYKVRGREEYLREERTTPLSTKFRRFRYL